MGNALKIFLFMHAIDYIMRVVLLKDFRKIEKKITSTYAQGLQFCKKFYTKVKLMHVILCS